MSKLAIMQPTYLPWLGYFDLIDQADIFVFLDNVQLEKSSWQLRNKIKTVQGELFLTIRRQKSKGDNILQIKDTLIDDKINWRRKHLSSIRQSYSRAPFYSAVYESIESQINNDIKYLAEFNIRFIKYIAAKIGIDTKFITASEDLNNISSIKDERLIEMCKILNCTEYVSPIGAAAYIDREVPGGAFSISDIELSYHNYEHPVYKQQYGEFLPYMGIIDLLFNHGFDNSLDIVRSGRRELLTSV